MMRPPGLAMLAQAHWPEAGDEELPGLPGFVLSTFNPLVAVVADRCLGRRHGIRPAPADVGERTAVILISASGDLTSAEHVAGVVASGDLLGPLFFFQSVPNSVAGYVAARWQLGGPVVCLCPTGDPLAAATAAADLLVHDGDADEALLVLVEQARDERAGDRAHAMVVRRGEQ